MLKKASKRLVCAIIALVASVLLCIGVCLAWFAANNDVRGEGLQTQLRSEDIVNFKVTVYYLNETATGAKTFSKASSGNDENIKNLQNNPITVDYNNDGEINSTGGKDVMRPFSLDNKYTTAVLYKIDYILSKDTNTDKNFRIFAECPQESRIKVEKSGEDHFTSDLSNAVRFFNAELSNSVYTPASGDGEAFTALDADKQLREKRFRLDFYDTISLADITKFTEITADNAINFGDTDKKFIGNYGGTKYVIMDYGSDRFAYLASLMLENDGSLSSGLTLTGDITIGMEEYTVNETAAVPEKIEVDPVTYATQAAIDEAFTQPIGSDIMSHKWRFVVTYSDGSKKVMRGTNSNLSSNNKKGINIDTSSAGKKTVSVGYTEDSTTVTCDVPYTVNPVIIGGTGVAVNGTLTLKVITNTDGTADAGTKATWGLSDGATNASIESSTDTTVTIKGKVAGTVTVTAEVTIGDNKFNVTSDISVAGTNKPVSGVSLNETTATIAVGGTVNLTATVNPEDATNKEVLWSSSDLDVATVENESLQTVKVTGKKAGTATITVTTADGNKTATCTITVEEATVATHTVTFNMNGHGTDFTETVNDGEKVSKPTDPTAEGYTFGGWYKNESCTEEFNFSTAITADRTLYAKWTANGGGTTTSKTYTITVAGGKGVVDGGDNVTVAYMAKGGSDTSANDTDFKMDGGAAKITLTIKNAKANQNISVKVSGFTGSTGNDVDMKVNSVTNATGASTNPETIVFSKDTTDTVLGEGTFVFTADADGTVVIELARGMGRTTRVTGIVVTVG